MSALPENITQPLPAAIVAKMPVVDDSEYSILFDTGKFEQAYRVARLFSASKFVPEAYQGQPENCFVALQMATRLHIDPLMFMQKTYIVHNKPGMESTLAIALINSRGPFTGPIQWRLEGSGMGRKCTAFATHKQSGELCEAECTMEMAKAEGWLDKNGSKWKTLPELMLRYRSASFLGRLYAPECLMGIPTVDELHDTGQGSEIDVTPQTQPPSRSASTRLREIATRPTATDEQIDRNTGEVSASSNALAAEAQDEPAPTDEHLVELIRKGDYDEVRAIAGPKLQMVETMIASRENNSPAQEQRPSARRTRGTAPAPE